MPELSCNHYNLAVVSDMKTNDCFDRCIILLIVIIILIT